MYSLIKGFGALSLEVASKFHTCLKMFKHSNSSYSNQRGLEYHDGREEDLVVIKDWLTTFEGGQIECIKNENLGIAEIILDHPNKRNAMSGSMMAQLGDIISELENWSHGKAILLHGKGSMLCSGGDLDFAKASAGPKGGFRMACYMHNVLSRLKALPMVSVALIHGQGALGGGAEIAVACDWRLMTSDCRGIGLVHTRMGIVPAWGASSRLASLIGSRMALELITSSRIVTPNESLQIGLIDAVVEPGIGGNGLEDALKWLSKHTTADAQVIRAAKATMTNYEQQIGFNEALEVERRLFAPLWGGAANQQALSSHIKHLK